MDKYIVSSPNLIAQRLDTGSEPLATLNAGDIFGPQEKFGVVDSRPTEDHKDLMYSIGSDSSNDSLSDVVPVSNNSLNNSYKGFLHMKSVSVDDDLRGRGRMLHKSTPSVASLSQEPPYQTVNPVYSSTNTLNSVESIPPLSTSVSCQSLLDVSTVQNLVQQQHQKYSYQQQLPSQHQATPIRSRKKSLSASSANNLNLYTTPMRGVNTALMSPVNLAATSTSSKVSKTPYSAKGKGHSRSRSRLSLDSAANNTLVAYSSGSLKPSSSNQTSASSMNPFYYTPISNSPLGDKFEDSEEFGTPLQTPNSNVLGKPQGGTYQQFSYFSSANNNLGAIASDQNMANVSLRARKSDPIESINIEDQEDNALEQLRRAKLVSSAHRNEANMSLSATPDVLQESFKEKPDPRLPPKGDAFFSETDLLLKDSNNFGLRLEQNFVPSSLEGQNSSDSSNFYNTNSIEPSNIYSFPPMEFSSDIDFQSLDMYSGNQQYRGHGIDLLQPQMSLAHDKPKTPAVQNQTLMPSFSKSYPVSVDLASSTPTNYSQHLANSYKDRSNSFLANRGNISAGLPQMSTFSVPNNLKNIHGQGNTYLPGDLKLPIKISDKADVIDPKKKHACPLCHARFQRPEHVKRHLKSHSTEKPYECDEPNCGKRFNRKDNLKAHLKKIHHRQF